MLFSCRITDQSEQIAYYLSLAVPSAIIVIVGLCVYLFVILWIYCCRNCCSHPHAQINHMPLNDGYLESISSTLNKNNNNNNIHHQQQQHHLLNPGSNPDGSSSINSYSNNIIPPTVFDSSDANLTAFKKHVLSMTILLALFSATWLFAQSLDLQTFDFVFCFANVTQSWLFFSEKCILLSEARNAWKRLFNNSGTEYRNEDTARGKLLSKNASPVSYGVAVSPTHSLGSNVKDTLDKRDLINNNHSNMSTLVTRTNSGSQNSILNTLKHERGSPASANNQVQNSSPSNSNYDPKSASYYPNQNRHVSKDSNAMSNGNFPLANNSRSDFGKAPTLRKLSALNASAQNPALQAISVFTGYAGSDPSFFGHDYSPNSRECLEGGDAYGATYMQSSTGAFDRETPSVADSDPNRESYV